MPGISHYIYQQHSGRTITINFFLKMTKQKPRKVKWFSRSQKDLKSDLSDSKACVPNRWAMLP